MLAALEQYFSIDACLDFGGGELQVKSSGISSGPSPASDAQ